MRNYFLLLALTTLPLLTVAQEFSVQSVQKINNVEGGLTGNPLQSDDIFGEAVEVIGDVNHDGIDDIAIGAFKDDDGGTNHGAVYILMLNEDGTVKAQQKISHTTGGGPPKVNGQFFFGSSIAALGDLNGDGNVDIAVGAEGADDAGQTLKYKGAIWILFLDDDGTVLEHQKISNNNGGGPGDLSDNDKFGASIANIGDINQDGLPDLAVSAVNLSSSNNKGAVYIVNLDYNGTAKGITKITEGSGGFGGTLDTNEHFAIGVAGIGDIDDDGITDIAIGSRSGDGGNRRGAVWICFMTDSGYVKSEQKISDTQGGFTGTLDNGDEFGYAVLGIGDVDGNGVPDVLATAYGDDDGGTNEGALWFLYLNADGTVKDYKKLATTDALLAAEVGSNEKFGTDISLFGDRNNDGKIDLLLGAYEAEDATATATGEVYILHLEGVSTYPTKTYAMVTPFSQSVVKHSADVGQPLAGELGAYDLYGAAIANIGDLDGDGINDMIVGSFLDDDGGTDRGALYVQFLNADGTIKSYKKISSTKGNFSGSLDNFDRFGASVCNLGDLDGDGVIDIAVGAFLDDDGGTDRGAVWILFLNTDGTVKDEQKISDTAGGFNGILDNQDYFGFSVTSPGDIDKDGVVDLTVTSLLDDDGGTGRGAVWVLFLDTNGTVKDEQKISDTQGNFNEGLANEDLFGSAICSLGDMDNDGVVDIAVGAARDDESGTDEGAFYVLFLTDSGTVKEYKKIGKGKNGFNGYLDALNFFALNNGLEGGYDLNQDGVNDILVGSRNADVPTTDVGLVWVLFMNADGTVSYHKTIGATTKGLTEKLDDSDEFGTAVKIIDYNLQNNTMKMAVGSRRDDNGATDAGAVYLLSTDLMSTYNPSPTASPSLHRSLTDLGYNWSYGESYDENGKLLGASKQYVDELGRNTQNLALNIDKNRVLTTQTVYDAYGRPVLNTLPAPTGVNFTYKSNFMTNVAGTDYNYTHFDGAKLNNPDSVGSSVNNALGDYYSNSGEDDYMATSAFPYSRMEYMADPTGRVKRTAAPGENFKMGSGHENKVFYLFTGGELDKVYGTDSSFYSQTNAANRLESKALSNHQIVADKTISVDAEGNIAISFKSDGLTIASCVSGKDATKTQNALHNMLYEGTQSVDIHLPEAKSTTLQFPLTVYTCNMQVLNVDSSDLVYTLTDLETNELLTLGVDYTLQEVTVLPDPTYLKVTFTGANKHRFLRVSYAYTTAKLAHFTSCGITPPNASVRYELDYSHFTVNYYDLAGRLRKNVSPKGYGDNGAHTEFTHYDYDPFGQIIAKETPDEGLMEYLYSDEGVVRFSQNAQQRADNTFSYIRYDAYNRAIESGEYNESGAVFEFAGYYDTAAAGTDVKDTINTVGFDFNDSYCSSQNYIAYDVLASADEIPAAYSYKSQYTQNNLKARVSKTWNEYNQTWYSYDYAGRPEFVVQELVDTAFSSTKNETVKTIDYTYAPVTSVLEKEEYQKNYTAEKMTHHFTYNDNLQITGVVAANNTDTVGQAAFDYYINGQLKRKELGGTLQGIDYVYTLQGQLKSINHPALYDAYDPGQDGKTGSDNAAFAADVFGMALDYYEDDYTRSGSNITSSVSGAANGYHNGLIKATRWRIKDQNTIAHTASYDTLYTETATDKELMYNYTYDDFYRFETANFGVYNNGSNDFTAQNDFKVYGGSTDNGVAYDIIGNISNLYRNGYDGSLGLNMDSLSYSYTSGTSQLVTITDNSTNTYTNDFETTAADTFTYNNLGQMIASDADGVDTVDYYPNGQVQRVVFDNGNTAEYYYNERNIKIKSKFNDVGAGTTKHNWYITDASGALKSVHEKTQATSVSLTQQAIYGGGRLGMYDVSAGMLNYELTDHLGNVRATIRDTSATATPQLEVTSWADYYPFGEVLPGRNSDPTGMFGYQGQERVSNDVNGVGNNRWYNFQLRMYNPALGRFNTIDPYSQFNSPYLAMANNPISYVDPTGGVSVAVWRSRERANFLNEQNGLRQLQSYIGFFGTDAVSDMTLLGMLGVVDGGSSRGGAGGSGTLSNGVPVNSETFKGDFFGSEWMNTVFENGMGVSASRENGIRDPFLAMMNIDVNDQLTKIYKKDAQLRADLAFEQELTQKKAEDAASKGETVQIDNNAINLPVFTTTANDPNSLRNLVSHIGAYLGGLENYEGPMPLHEPGTSLWGVQSKFLPVAKSVGGGFDLFSPYIGMTNSGGGILITQGPETGRFYSYMDLGIGNGKDVSVSLREINFFYNGDIDQFTSDNLRGFRTEGSFGITYDYFDFSGSFSESVNTTFTGGKVYGFGAGVGFGFGNPFDISWNWNWGYTAVDGE